MAFSVYQNHPDAYVKYVHGGSVHEGEFFRDIINEWADPDTKVGYIRPIDKELRQWLVDDRNRVRSIDCNVDFQSLMFADDIN